MAVDYIWVGKGFGYHDPEDSTVCMIRCFACGEENYAMVVASGECAWCGATGGEELAKQGETKK